MGWNRIKKLFKKRKKPEQLDKMMLHSRQVKEGVFEVNGVIFYSDTHVEAMRKYRRALK